MSAARSGAYRAMGTPQSIMYHGRTGMKVTYDGMGILNMAGDGNVSYIINSQTVEEMTMETRRRLGGELVSGFAANSDSEGGRQRRSRFELSGMYTNDNLQSDNLSDDLRARGVTTVDKTLRRVRHRDDGRRAPEEGQAVVLRRDPGRREARTRRPGSFTT